VGGLAERILIVDDEPDIAATVAFNLEREGFTPITAHDGASALAALQADPPPDLVILDLMLPDMSGTEICRRIRQEPATARLPVVMLTARSEDIDRVVGFEVGADDYVVKPFSTRELVLRVRAILRRSEAAATDSPSTRTIGPLRLDFDGHRLWVDGEEILLTALEFRLLKTLVQRRGRVQTRETLLTQVWEMNGELTTRTVDTHVRRLRKKLGSAAVYIETLRGVGYRFQPEPAKAT
jgi:two-component system, OmpR family, phosphate regulon response regulator PhoB